MNLQKPAVKNNYIILKMEIIKNVSKNVILENIKFYIPPIKMETLKD